VKIALLFFWLITHGCGTPASWAARHTTMCLDQAQSYSETNTKLSLIESVLQFKCCTCMLYSSLQVGMDAELYFTLISITIEKTLRSKH